MKNVGYRILVKDLIVSELKDISRAEGSNKEYPVYKLDEFVSALEPGEWFHRCRYLDCPDQRGYIPARDIADLFRRR
jgi:hypothetical protein